MSDLRDRMIDLAARAILREDDDTPEIQAAAVIDALGVEGMHAHLAHAVEIIREHIPEEALGINWFGAEDRTSAWPIRDEYLAEMEAALARATGGDDE